MEPEWGLFLWLSMVTGSRRGELCALRWRHVDLDRGTLAIDGSVAQTRAGLVEKSTKSSQGRGVALDPQTVEFLRAHRARVESRCADLGILLTANGFVFSLDPDSVGPLLPHSVTQRYRRLAIRLGLRSTRLHALRHNTATELLAAGVDLRTVAGRLGHSDGGATTLRIYAGRVAEADRRAAAQWRVSCRCPTRPSANRPVRTSGSLPIYAARSPQASWRLAPSCRPWWIWRPATKSRSELLNAPWHCWPTTIW